MKILCAVDESEFSLRAMESVGKLFRHSVKELILLHVVDLGILRRGGGRRAKKDEITQDFVKTLEAAGQKILAECAHQMNLYLSQAATKPFAAIKTAMVKGHTANAIITYAEKIRPDLVVVGSRGMHDLPGYLLGSISRTVLTHGPCSVLTVKAPPLDVPVSVLLALDGSKPSKFAANRVKEWLSPEEVTLQLVSVVPDILTDVSRKMLPKSRLKSLVAPLRQQAEECLEHYRELFLKAGFQVTGKRLQGNPREQILESVPACHAQLVVMGSKGLTGLDRFTMGSVSEWVSAYAPSSVLVVRH
jgi:nucleotide-binding universal stress UspA family protein